AFAVRLLAGFLANRVYGVPALEGLLRAAAPLTLLFSMQQAAGTLLTGLGEQKRTLLPTIAGAALTLFLTWHWAASPFGAEGAVYALLLGRAAALLGELAAALRLLFTGSAAPEAPQGG
ncbi:MAG: polysaccharide biosynthesis C-terminal domain-containing protein, partial [Clostridia bacterium]|nr:polysaccharide biosynthesis C-terminal domain-containing protein [Clostridia bacterium]